VTTAEEKVWEYLTTHKKPVMAGTLAKRFLLSQSHVNRVLRDLDAEGKVDVLKIGGNKFYKAKT